MHKGKLYPAPSYISRSLAFSKLNFESFSFHSSITCLRGSTISVENRHQVWNSLSLLLERFCKPLLFSVERIKRGGNKSQGEEAGWKWYSLRRSAAIIPRTYTVTKKRITSTDRWIPSARMPRHDELWPFVLRRLASRALSVEQRRRSTPGCIWSFHLARSLSFSLGRHVYLRVILHRYIDRIERRLKGGQEITAIPYEHVEPASAATARVSVSPQCITIIYHYQLYISLAHPLYLFSSSHRRLAMSYSYRIYSV